MRPKPQTPSKHSPQLNKVNKLLPSQLSAFNVEFHLITPCCSGSTGREGQGRPHTRKPSWTSLSLSNLWNLLWSYSHWNNIPLVEVYHKHCTEINLNANSYSYFCICTAFQSWVLSSVQLRHTVSKSRVVWEITRFTHQSSYCNHHQIIKGSSSPRLRSLAELLAMAGRGGGCVRNTFNKQGGQASQLPLSLLPAFYSLQMTSSEVSLGKDFWLSSSSRCRSSKRPHQVFSTTYTCKLLMLKPSSYCTPYYQHWSCCAPSTLSNSSCVFHLWNIKLSNNQNPSVLSTICVF